MKWLGFSGFNGCTRPLANEPASKHYCDQNHHLLSPYHYHQQHQHHHQLHQIHQHHYLAVWLQSQSFQCKTPNPKMSWEKVFRYFGHHVFGGSCWSPQLVTLYLVTPVGHLVLEEGEAVLTVPVVGLVLHPVEPGRVQMIVVMTVLMIETHTRWSKTQTNTNKHKHKHKGTLSKKNYGIIWEFFRSGGPPPSPLLGTPYSKKKNYRLFCILGP